MRSVRMTLLLRALASRFGDGGSIHFGFRLLEGFGTMGSALGLSVLGGSREA